MNIHGIRAASVNERALPSPLTHVRGSLEASIRAASVNERAYLFRSLTFAAPRKQSDYFAAMVCELLLPSAMRLKLCCNRPKSRVSALAQQRCASRMYRSASSPRPSF
jgi:hypothetical protein